jgi:peptidoglycan/xylan/chitin deacetylase (PgdA/CDA1 family)
MHHFLILFLLSALNISVFSQDSTVFINSKFLRKLNNDLSYTGLRIKISQEFASKPAGQWGEFVKGVDEEIVTQKKIIAFTFDACGGKNGNGYDKELIEYLQNERIPATLFVSGKWIDANYKEFIKLSRDSLFEIENHGFNHRPCAIKGEMAYGIKGTANIEDAFDEIEANARKIKAITNRRPLFYRPATAYIDEACSAMAARLGIIPVTYEVLSGDAIPRTAKNVIENNVEKNIRPGAIVIMHFNHPEWNTKEAMVNIVPELRSLGYDFVLLKNHSLASIKKVHTNRLERGK